MKDLQILNEKKFFFDLEKCKHMIDKGLTGYFIDVENTTCQCVDGMENLTLAEIEECYGEEYIYFFRFAYNGNPQSLDDPENISSLRYRRLKEFDKKRLRGMYRYFPSDCWVCEWIDAEGSALVLPFVQTEDGVIRFLYEIPACRNDLRKFKKEENELLTLPQGLTNKIMAKLPWYAECMYAIINYKGNDIVIPIEPSGARITFKSRERDEYGVKRRLIHRVNEHARVGLVNCGKVSSHMRGTSTLSLNGEDIIIAASWEWSIEELKKSTESKK